jgi:hypothetical protein
LELYANGTPAPTVVTKEVDMTVEAPFLLTKPDFSKTEVVKAYVQPLLLLLWITGNRQSKLQERDSDGANEDSACFEPAACLGQQDFGV